MKRIIILALFLAGCASTPASDETGTRIRDEVQQERQEDRVRQMQEEFNRTVPDG